MNKAKFNTAALLVTGAFIGSVGTIVFVRLKYKDDMKFLGIAHALVTEGIDILNGRLDEDDY